MKRRSTTSKEATANLFNRYVWLVDTIYRSGEITFEEINSKWTRSPLNESGDNLPLKTFHNHRKAIERMFDLNIECNRKAGYTYFIENEEDMENGGARQWLLDSLSVNRLVNESHLLKKRILLERIPGGQKFLAPILEAMQDGKTVEITYRSFFAEKSACFPVEPYCVKVFKQRWYLVGLSVNDDTIRIYSLDRMERVQTTDRAYVVPADFDPANFFENSYGVLVDDEVDVEQIDIKVYGKQVLYVRALPLHLSQTEVQTTKSYSVFSYRLRPTYDFRQEILSNGPNFEVLAPGYFREEIREALLSTIKRYENH